MRLIILLFTLVLIISCNHSTKNASKNTEIVTEEITYKTQSKTMKGYLVKPTGAGPFPGVVVVHEWWGQTEYPREKARELAKQGYIALAADMYGQGKTASHPKDAKAFSSKVMDDLDEAEKSFRAALETLKRQPNVDKEKIGAIGYCFGGGIVLEMARRGLDLDLVASFHGNLTPIVKNQVTNIKGQVLVFNGADDSFVPQTAITQFKKKMENLDTDYIFVNYAGAKHGFSNPEATANGEKFNIPLAYNESADKKSWQRTLQEMKRVW